MIKVGETVRFLNAVGGGVVTRTDARQGLLYVEDSDGFEIPVLERECVAVPAVNEKTNFPLKDFKANNTQTNIAEPVFIPEVKEELPVVETPEGDQLQVALAFVPADVKNLQKTTFGINLVNDSNYYLYFNLIYGLSGEEKTLSHGQIEPNMFEEIASFDNSDMEPYSRLQVQILAFKKDKVYQPQTVINHSIQFSPIRFLKLHSFTANDYFEDPALVYMLTENEQEFLKKTDLAQLKEEMFKKDAPLQAVKSQGKPSASRPPVIEVDLHADALLETKVGMNNADILQVQMEHFHRTLAENKNFKGQKIVFIHGKGEGVLRNEILRQLKNKYKTYTSQDASFREYGFGATMVTIR